MVSAQVLTHKFGTFRIPGMRNPILEEVSGAGTRYQEVDDPAKVLQFIRFGPMVSPYIRYGRYRRRISP